MQGILGTWGGNRTPGGEASTAAPAAASGYPMLDAMGRLRTGDLAGAGAALPAVTPAPLDLDPPRAPDVGVAPLVRQQSSHSSSEFVRLGQQQLRFFAAAAEKFSRAEHTSRQLRASFAEQREAALTQLVPELGAATVRRVREALGVDLAGFVPPSEPLVAARALLRQRQAASVPQSPAALAAHDAAQQAYALAATAQKTCERARARARRQGSEQRAVAAAAAHAERTATREIAAVDAELADKYDERAIDTLRAHGWHDHYPHGRFSAAFRADHALARRTKDRANQRSWATLTAAYDALRAQRDRARESLAAAAPRQHAAAAAAAAATAAEEDAAAALPALVEATRAAADAHTPHAYARATQCARAEACRVAAESVAALERDAARAVACARAALGVRLSAPRPQWARWTPGVGEQEDVAAWALRVNRLEHAMGYLGELQERCAVAAARLQQRQQRLREAVASAERPDRAQLRIKHQAVLALLGQAEWRDAEALLQAAQWAARAMVEAPLDIERWAVQHAGEPWTWWSVLVWSVPEPTFLPREVRDLRRVDPGYRPIASPIGAALRQRAAAAHGGAPWRTGAGSVGHRSGAHGAGAGRGATESWDLQQQWLWMEEQFLLAEAAQDAAASCDPGANVGGDGHHAGDRHGAAGGGSGLEGAYAGSGSGSDGAAGGGSGVDASYFGGGSGFDGSYSGGNDSWSGPSPSTRS